MFISPNDEVYKGMIVGVHQRPSDLEVNICKTKALTNMRSAGKDNYVGIVPPLELTLDGAVGAGSAAVPFPRHRHEVRHDHRACGRPQRAHATHVDTVLHVVRVGVRV